MVCQIYIESWIYFLSKHLYKTRLFRFMLKELFKDAIIYNKVQLTAFYNKGFLNNNEVKTSASGLRQKVKKLTTLYNSLVVNK